MGSPQYPTPTDLHWHAMLLYEGLYLILKTPSLCLGQLLGLREWESLSALGIESTEKEILESDGQNFAKVDKGLDQLSAEAPNISPSIQSQAN